MVSRGQETASSPASVLHANEEGFPVPLGALSFFFDPPADWPVEPVAVAFRIRGVIGKRIRGMHCLYDSERTPCRGCAERPSCFYGSGFETLENVEITGFGRVGALPHEWSLAVDRIGQGWRVTLWLIGRETERAELWYEAIASLPFAVEWTEAEDPARETRAWRSLTPVRLRVDGRNAGAEELAQALAASIARRSRMLAAIHGLAAPESRLEVADLVPLGWIDVERYSFRHRRRELLGGWMLRVQWPDDVGDWEPWLRLARVVGAGRQTSFGLGRFAPLDA